MKITNAAGDRPVLWIYGVIGEKYGGITADDLRMALNSVGGDQAIDVRYHSEGGEFHEGIAMHSLLSRHGGDVRGIVDGLAASAATFPLMASDTVEMAAGAWVMIHQVRAELIGKVVESELESYLDRMKATNEQIFNIYRARWKGSEEDLRAALKTDYWLNSGDATAAGLADVVTDDVALAARVEPEMFGYTNVPNLLLAAHKGPMADYEARILEIDAELTQKKEQTCEPK